MVYALLAIAIVCEVVATSALKASEGFTKLWPSIAVVLGYGSAFYFLSLVLQSMSVGIAYAIWAGLGIVLVTVVGALIFRQMPDAPAILGMVLITSGVIIINVFSKTVTH